jgi:hypothetical protein
MMMEWIFQWLILCSFASSYSLRLIESPSPLMGVTSDAIAWHPGGLIVSWAESLHWPWDLFMACDCGKCLVLKGLAVGQSYFDELLKYIFTYSQLVIGNLPAMF